VKRLVVALETQFAYVKPTGLGTYARKLAQALRGRSDVVLVEIAYSNLNVWRFDRRLVWDQVVAPFLARRAHADVTHFTGGTLPLGAPRPNVLSLHDLAWLDGAVRGRPYSRVYFGLVQRRLARRADRIVADTLTARDEIVRRLEMSPARVAVCGAGVDEEWFGIVRRPDEPAYVLAVGTVEERKDLETAVRAVARVPGLRLVSAGAPTAYASRVGEVVRALGVGDRVSLAGYVSEERLHALYAGASALIFPSRYEGFGLPPLQALAAGVPVIASDIPVLREVLGDCALFAPPGDVDAFADALRRILADERSLRPMIERGRMRARDFSWAGVAQRVVGVYRSLVS
jgi:glycosyltransferase involved in cell wall biosynthesis